MFITVPTSGNPISALTLSTNFNSSGVNILLGSSNFEKSSTDIPFFSIAAFTSADVSLLTVVELLPPLTSSLTTYIFPSSSFSFEKNQHSPKQWFSLPKILPYFLCLYYKKLPLIPALIPVVLHLWHDILGLIFQHSIDDVD